MWHYQSIDKYETTCEANVCEMSDRLVTQHKQNSGWHKQLLQSLNFLRRTNISFKNCLVHLTTSCTVATYNYSLMEQSLLAFPWKEYMVQLMTEKRHVVMAAEFCFTSVRPSL